MKWVGMICANDRGVKRGDVKFPLMPEYAPAYEGQDRACITSPHLAERRNQISLSTLNQRDGSLG